MKQRTIYNTLILIFLTFNSSAQIINISELKSQKKDSIVQFALDQLLIKNISINTIKNKETRVMANSKSVYVLFNMGFKKDTNNNTFENYDLEIYFSSLGMTIIPYDFELNSRKYICTVQENKLIKKIISGDSCHFASDVRIKIEEKSDYYELSFHRGSSKGAECYRVDKKTFERSLLWHEHPNPNTKLNIPKTDEFIEIK
jgi:hypothetical protein